MPFGETLTFGEFLEIAQRKYRVKVITTRFSNGAEGLLLVRILPDGEERGSSRVFETLNFAAARPVKALDVHQACVRLRMKMADFGFLGYS